MNDYPLESFVFYRSFRDAISEMSDENKLATLLAICDYALYGVEPKLKDAMARAVFTVARPSIDANKGRRANGKKGGRPPKKPMVSDFENQWISKGESTETETVSETETDAGANGAGKPPTPARRKYGTYNWIRLTDDEYARLEHDLGAVELARCIAYVDESAQGNGNKNRWKDWFVVIQRCHREGWGAPKAKPTATGGANFQPTPERIQKNNDWLDAFLAEQRKNGGGDVDGQ